MKVALGWGLLQLLVVKSMWGDKFQAFDCAQASNPGGPEATQPSAPIASSLISEFGSECLDKNGREGNADEVMTWRKGNWVWPPTSTRLFKTNRFYFHGAASSRRFVLDGQDPTEMLVSQDADDVTLVTFWWQINLVKESLSSIWFKCPLIIITQHEEHLIMEECLKIQTW